MSTIARGNAAEAAVIEIFERHGMNTLVPFGGGCPFDLVAVLPSAALLRVQVKSGRIRNACVEFNSCATDHGNGRLDYRGRADVFAVHVAATSAVYIVPVHDCPSFRGYLRLEPTRNNQRKRVRMAEDHTFERWVAGLG